LGSSHVLRETRAHGQANALSSNRSELQFNHRIDQSSHLCNATLLQAIKQ
jgi:hypothetical protein